MIKIILLVALFSACGFLGINVSKIYSEKYNFYKELLTFCKSLKTDISFLKTDILSIMQKTNFKSKLSNILDDVKILLTKNTIINKNEFLISLEKYQFLTEQDKSCLCLIFCEIGNLGYDEELSKIEYNINSVEMLMDDFKQNKLKLATLSKKMGFLLGFLVCIILI